MAANLYWRGTGSDIIAAVQSSAWKDAQQAGARFVSAELVSHYVRRPTDWVQSFWKCDVHKIARNIKRGLPLPPPEIRRLIDKNFFRIVAI